MTWITMAIVILIAVLATRHLKEAIPVGWQNAVEAVVNLLQEGRWMRLWVRKDDPWRHCLLQCFVLLIANWLGLCPGMASPTNDLNTTLGMAIMVSLVIHGIGLAKQV